MHGSCTISSSSSLGGGLQHHHQQATQLRPTASAPTTTPPSIHPYTFLRANCPELAYICPADVAHPLIVPSVLLITVAITCRGTLLLPHRDNNQVHQPSGSRCPADDTTTPGTTPHTSTPKIIPSPECDPISACRTQRDLCLCLERMLSLHHCV